VRGCKKCFITLPDLQLHRLIPFHPPPKTLHIHTICPCSKSLFAYAKYSYASAAPPLISLLLTHTRCFLPHLSQLYPTPSVFWIGFPSLLMARRVVTFGLPRGPPFHQAMASRAAVRTARGTLAVGITVVPWRKCTVLLLSGESTGCGCRRGWVL
jgi:hypothetical protein